MRKSLRLISLLALMVISAPLSAIAVPCPSLPPTPFPCDLPVITHLTSLDLIFVIDTTGSMSPYIAALKTDAATLVDAVKTNVDSFRLAVVTYKDFPPPGPGDVGDFPFRDDLVFSTTAGPVTAALLALTVGGGGDTPESVYSALMHAIAATSLGGWSGTKADARMILVMGDAPPHDPEPVTGFTLATVLAAAQDPVILTMVALGSNPATLSSFKALADGTGGDFLNAATPGDVGLTVYAGLGKVTASAAAVPQPPTVALVGLGAAILLACAEYWRRRQAATS